MGMVVADLTGRVNQMLKFQVCAIFNDVIFSPEGRRLLKILQDKNSVYRGAEMKIRDFMEEVFSLNFTGRARW